MFFFFICSVDNVIIGLGDGLLLAWHPAIIWTNADLLAIWPLLKNFNEIMIKIQAFSFKKMQLKMLSAKCWPYCLGLKVLTHKQLEMLRSVPNTLAPKHQAMRIHSAD